MKKLITILLLCLTLTVLAGCIKSDPITKSDPLTSALSTDSSVSEADFTQESTPLTVSYVTGSPVTTSKAVYTTGVILEAIPDTIEEGISWPSGQVIPWFATPAKTIDAFETKNFEGDELFSLVSLQGLVNKTKPSILVLDTGAEEGKSAWSGQIPATVKSVSTSRTYKVISEYASTAAGVVLYSTGRSKHYVNLASSVAGVMNAIPMTRLVYEKWKENGVSLDIICDLTKLEYSTPEEIYTYLYENYWDKCNHRLVISLDPSNRYNLRDIGNAVSCASLYLDCRKESEKKVFEKFLADMTPGDGIVMGWYTTERSGVSTVASFGLSTVPADFFNNATVYAGLPHTITNNDVPNKPELENKRYVVAIISDGDNIQYNQHAMRKKWDASTATRGATALSWTVSPALADIAPNILNYYYRTAKDGDCLICGPSGLGYSLIVNTLSEDGAPEKNYMSDLNKFTEYVKLTNTYLKRCGLRVVTIWDYAEQDQLEIYTKEADYLWGVTVHHWFNKIKDMTRSINNKLVQQLDPCYCSKVNDAYGLLYGAMRKAADDAPSFYAVQISVWGDFTPAKVTEMSDKLNSRFKNVEFVRADHYYALYNEANGLPFDLTLSSKLTESVSSGEKSAKYLTNGTPTGKIWEADEQGPQTVTLSLGQEYLLSKAVLYHAQQAGKSESLNTKSYTLEVSENGTDYTKIYEVNDNTESVNSIVIDNVRASYFRITISEPGADMIARLANIELYGSVIK